MKIRWSPGAERNLEAIVDYIALESPRAALSIYEEIRRQVGRLADFPLSARAGRVRGTRELVIVGTPYVVVYRVKARDVEISRVLHGAQRWPPRRGGL